MGKIVLKPFCRYVIVVLRNNKTIFRTLVSSEKKISQSIFMIFIFPLLVHRNSIEFSENVIVFAKKS